MRAGEIVSFNPTSLRNETGAELSQNACRPGPGKRSFWDGATRTRGLIMGSSHPVERRRGGRRTALMNGITWMMSRSLVIYVAALLVQRTWTLLNSDVTNVIRRL